MVACKSPVNILCLFLGTTTSFSRCCVLVGQMQTALLEIRGIYTNSLISKHFHNPLQINFVQIALSSSARKYLVSTDQV